MKRAACLTLVLIMSLLMIPCHVLAADSVICHPGDTISVAFTLSADGDQPDGVMGQLQYDEDIFILLPSREIIGMDGINILNRQPVTVSFRVSKYAPAGRYEIRVKVIEAYDADGKKYMNTQVVPVQVTIESPIMAAPEITPSPTPTGKPLPSAASADKKQIKAGDYVTFGRYPQTAAGNDMTPIEWEVLDVDGDKALLLSRYGLEASPYNTKNTNVTWDTCTLRSWLNREFLSKAFNDAEQEAIVTTKVDNSSSQGYSEWNTDGGNNTEDKIFLMSYSEAEKYLNVQHYRVSGSNNNRKSRVSPTEYAKKQGAYTDWYYETTDGSASGWWWLRSPGSRQNSAAYVTANDSLSRSVVSSDTVCVRPALWVNLYNLISNNSMTEPAEESGSQDTHGTAGSPVKAGDYVTFGRYPQMAAGKDETPIEWLVLEVQGNKALLLSRYGLDTKRFNLDRSEFTWETSSLRNWLYAMFLKKAFNSDEQQMIQMTDVDNSESQKNENNTQDKVFLLSEAEAKQYLNVQGSRTNIKARVSPTEYAESQGTYTESEKRTAEGNAAGTWWLRSIYIYDQIFYAATVRYDGSLSLSYATADSVCVRPAMWVSLDAFTE